MTLTGNPSLINSGFDVPPSNPVVLFKNWLDQANKLKVSEPKGVVLSTVNASGHPSSRVILLKDLDETGFTFVTRQESTKGQDLKLNPWAAGTLWWRETMQQINMQGFVTQLPKEISQAIFQARPREAQAVAALCEQSSPLLNEEELKTKVLALINAKKEIECPDSVSAYHFSIKSIEFWHGDKNRFHKRLRYDLKNGAWSHQRLQP